MLFKTFPEIHFKNLYMSRETIRDSDERWNIINYIFWKVQVEHKIFHFWKNEDQLFSSSSGGRQITILLEEKNFERRKQNVEEKRKSS